MNTLVEKHIKYLEDKTFFVPAILEDEETFEEFRVNMYQMFKDGFEVKELREAPAKFIFKLDEEPHVMQVRRFYINLLMWYPLCLFGCPNDIDESFIVDDFTAGARINYFNEKIFKPYVGKVENSLINFAVLESLHMLQEIAIDFNVIMGGSMNLLDYVKLSNTNLITVNKSVGVNTVGSSLRNASHDIRGDVLVSKLYQGPWNMSTIDPDMNNVGLSNI